MDYQILSFNSEDEADDCLDLFQGSSGKAEIDGWEENEYADLLLEDSIEDIDVDDWITEEYEDIFDGHPTNYKVSGWKVNEEDDFMESEDIDDEIPEKGLPVMFTKGQERNERGIQRNDSINPAKIREAGRVKDNLSNGYDMHELEQIILKKICIRRIHERLYYFDGRIYRALDNRRFMRLMRERLSDDTIGVIPSYGKMEEIYKFLNTNPDVKLDVSDEMERFTKRVIVFANGVYDVEREKLLDFSEDYPVLFDIDARYLGDTNECETPCFDRFLNTVSGGDKDIEKQIWQMIGYLIMQGNEGKVFFVLGTERNSGKSLLGEFISRLFDEEMVANIPLTSMGERFVMGSLWKKAINVSMDLPTKILTENEVSRIKLLTGECRINTEEKYEPAGTTFNHCRSLFATNGNISLKVNDDAFWDRVHFIPFMNSVERQDQDKDLLDKLLLERDGIATKAAKAAKKLIKNNFKFSESKMAKQVIARWKKQTGNLVEEFVKEKCDLNSDYEEFSSDIYECYKKYCGHFGVTPIGQPGLSRYLSQLPGVTSYKKRKNKDDNPISCIVGIRLKESGENYDTEGSD